MELNKIKANKITYLVILLVAGIVTIILSGGIGQKEATVPKEQPAVVPDASDTERRLARILETVEGVSDVSVFVTYDNKGTKELACNTDESKADDGQKQTSSVRTEIVTSKDGSGEIPFVKAETLPGVRGVIICARGVRSEYIRLSIADAVSSAMGVPLHRVRILSKD